MSNNIFKKVLTNREFDIMSILWESEDSLVASEIAKRGEGLTNNTVQAVLKKLLAKDLIKIDQIVYSGTVLTRSYAPTISAQDFEMNHLLASFQKLADTPRLTSSFVATLLEQEHDSQKLLTEIEQLEKMLSEKKRQLEQDGMSKKES